MKKLLSFAVVALLAMVACEKSSTDDTQKVSGTMTITSHSPIDFSFVGGTGEITFTLEGAKQGAKPSVECAQEWITGLAVDQTITFNVERSTLQEERTAIIFITQAPVPRRPGSSPANTIFTGQVLSPGSRI